MKRAILLIVTLLTLATPLVADDNVPEPTQRVDAPYRLFRTRNIYTFLKLDTRTGQVWQVQWGDVGYRWIVPINEKPLKSRRAPGRFTLYPTQNIYTFLLVDQEDGTTWQVQWGKDKERFLYLIE